MHTCIHVLTFTHQNGIEDCFQADFSFSFRVPQEPFFSFGSQGGVSTIFLEPSKGKQHLV